MLIKHLTFILRNLARNKIYAFFSIISLCFGLMCSILVYLYVTHELSYDTFFDHSDRIVRLESRSPTQSGRINKFAILPSASRPIRLHSIPEIIEHTRIATLPTMFLHSKGNDRIAENNGFAADSSFFDVFSFQILEGNTDSPLSYPNSVVITRKMAQKYFGRESPVGKTLSVYYGQRVVALTVTAVMENIPSHSHLDFNFLIDETSFEELFDRNISETYVAYEYLLLSKSANIKTVESKLAEIKPDIDVPENFKSVIEFAYVLQPITKIHLYSAARAEIQPNSDIRYVYIFSLLAIIILLISSVNFISLFLSHSLNRYKEVGVRKSLGAHASQLRGQFLLESICIAVLSLILALCLSYVSLPVFNSLTGKAFTANELLSFRLLWKFLVFAVLVGLLSGMYPAFILSKRGNANLPGSFAGRNARNRLFQNTIIVIQFAASAVLIIGTLVVYNQLNFMRNKDLGFNKERMITTANSLGKHLDTFKQILSNNANIESISASSYIPGTSETGGTGLVEALDNGTTVTCNWISVGYNFFNTYGIKVIEGRSFSKDFPTDSTQAFMINQAAAEALGLKEPVGKQIYSFNRTGKIIGVVEDFNYLSLHQQIPPMLFLIKDEYYFSLSIKLAKNPHVQPTLQDIEKAWYSLRPNIPFEYAFLEDRFNELYKSDRNIGKSFFVFSLIAIIVSCLGLFSLAAYSMQRRTKEIGIRKVLGATVLNILNLFYSKYFTLIIAANLLAIPVAYILLTNWLANFAYKIEIEMFPFLASFIATGVLTVLAISYWTFKAAYSNPIDSIRTK